MLSNKLHEKNYSDGYESDGDKIDIELHNLTKAVA